jgi:hypothetical protein
MIITRESRVGWPLLTVETVVNGDSKKRKNDRGPVFVGSLGLSCQQKRFCSALAALIGPLYKIFVFLAIHYFNSFDPIDQQAGQAAVLGRLSLSVCL